MMEWDKGCGRKSRPKGERPRDICNICCEGGGGGGADRQVTGVLCYANVQESPD